MARRVYSEVANSYAPFTQAVLQGLGAYSTPEPTDRNGWPQGRSYVGIAHFRAPYDEFGYFQDNTLNGLGHTPMQNSYVQVKGLSAALRGFGSIDPTEMDAINTNAPGAVKEFLLSGSPVPPLRGDITLPFNQVHPYVYGGIALAALAASYASYKQWKKTHPNGSSGSST
jgi:hypothetical protein